ncbi:MAG: MEDS domain-containing protein [Actinotalea sp.]|nr:MEDS domain-containing protein [Actinotalea sp.]
MRTTGEVADPRGLGAHDHLCWVFDDADDFHRRVSSYLAEGIEQGLAAVWVGTGSHDDLAAELVGLDVPGLERSGALSILALPVDRPPDGPADPLEQAAFWEDWTRRATGEGFRGLRAAGDSTDWVGTPGEQATHLAYEAALDHVTQRVPMSAMCAFDRSRLGREVAAAFAELHPLVSSGAAPFQLYFSDTRDLTLRGEVDLASSSALGRTLELVAPVGARPGGELHVDAGELQFIDHHGLLELERFGSEHGATLVLHDADVTCAREVLRVLGLAHVRAADGDGGDLADAGGRGVPGT